MVGTELKEVEVAVELRTPDDKTTDDKTTDDAIPFEAVPGFCCRLKSQRHSKDSKDDRLLTRTSPGEKQSLTYGDAVKNI